MNQTFGDFIDPEPNQNEYLVIGFSPNLISIQERWQNNSLSADFLADYFATFFPGGNQMARERRADMKGAISYIANELLENAMKFSYAPSKHSVSIHLALTQEQIRFYSTNSIDPKSIEGFKTFIHDLLTEDPDELMIRQLMTHADEENDTTNGSGMGFLTMINHYDARLAWKFCAQNNNVTTVTTMAELAF